MRPKGARSRWRPVTVCSLNSRLLSTSVILAIGLGASVPQTSGHLLGQERHDRLFSEDGLGRGSGAARPTPLLPHVVRQRVGRVNLSLLAGMPGEQARSRKPRSGETIVLNLFRDTDLVATLRQFERYSDGGYLWHGDVAGDPYSQAFFIVGDSGVTGEVFDGSRTYSVRPLSNGRHRIYEINPAALPENTPAPRSIYGTTNRNNRDAGDVDVVRLMIVLHRNANSVADSKTGGVGAAIVAPGVPENMSGSANGSTVNLSWNAPASGDPPAEYLLEAGSFPGASDIYDASVGNTTGVTATDVGAGTYYVRVRARNAAGTSAPSNEVELVVGGGGAGPCSSAPGAPLQLTWSANGSTVTLNWNAPRGSNPPTSYILEAGSASGSANLALADLGSTATEFVAGGVGPGTYYVRVRATNPCGQSAASNEAVVVVGDGGGGGGGGPSFGPGQYLVGIDIASGRYFTDPVRGCYWERQSGLSGGFGDILANDFIGFDARQSIVDILPSDVAFETDGDCRTWFNSPRHGFQSSVPPGAWLVGNQLAPGTYQATTQPGCYWERLRDFSGDFSAIIANDFVASGGNQLVAISASDAGFSTDDDCGTWTRIGNARKPLKSKPLDIEFNWRANRRQNGPQ